MSHIYTADRVLTGNQAEEIPDGAVVIDGDRIAWVGPVAQLPSEHQGTERTDLPGHSLLPGLIDVHVHLGSLGERHRPAPGDYTITRDTAIHLTNARRALSAGLTTVRNLGSRNYVDVAVRDAILDGVAQGPRIVAAGAPVTTTGGHDWKDGGEVDSITDIVHLVRTHHKNGVDAIKVMATGGFMTGGSAPWFPQFSVEELTALVNEARRLGKNTAAHAHGHEGIRRALAAGIDTLEHVSMFDEFQRRSVFDPKLADDIAAAGTFVDTTCEWRIPHIIASGSAFAPPVRELYDHGVKLVTGTDAGLPDVPHHAFPQGLEALASFGIPLSEVLTAATSRAAESVGLKGVTGELRAGLAADLIAVAGNPLADVLAYQALGLVVARGQEFIPDLLPPLPALADLPGPSITPPAHSTTGH